MVLFSICQIYCVKITQNLADLNISGVILINMLKKVVMLQPFVVGNGRKDYVAELTARILMIPVRNHSPVPSGCQGIPSG